MILLQTVPKGIEIETLEQEICILVPGVKSVCELHVWRLSQEKIIATAHLKCNESFDHKDIAKNLKELFAKKNIYFTTFQLEFTDGVF